MWAFARIAAAKWKRDIVCGVILMERSAWNGGLSTEKAFRRPWVPDAVNFLDEMRGKKVSLYGKLETVRQ